MFVIFKYKISAEEISLFDPELEIVNKNFPEILQYLESDYEINTDGFSYMGSKHNDKYEEIVLFKELYHYNKDIEFRYCFVVLEFSSIIPKLLGLRAFNVEDEFDFYEKRKNIAISIMVKMMELSIDHKNIKVEETEENGVFFVNFIGVDRVKSCIGFRVEG